ncbi:MAG TPA: hypothetical protein VIE43_27805 [Thermoanaerobaculia bacterium]|jgi:hypothetical protein|nr:hypothetical protein [Thermoanaerobaculia bacterium]
MRNHVSRLLFVLLFFALSGMGLALIPPPPLPNAFTTDVIWLGPGHADDPDPLCGFQILIGGPTAPANFYTGPREPWGNPVVQASPPGEWLMTYGGFGNLGAACYAHNDPRFWQNGIVGGTFLGLHFGFYTTSPLLNYWAGGIFPSATGWFLGMTDDDVVGAPPIVGFVLNHEVIDFTSSNAASVKLGNVQLAFSASEIPIENLSRRDLTSLSWQNVSLASNVVPAGTDSRQGTLAVPLPLAGHKGWAVVTYSVLDPKLGTPTSTTTLEFPVP